MTKLTLTSVSVPYNNKGLYKLHQLAFLIPNEMLRNELPRAEHAIKKIDVTTSPWKAKMFHEWLTAFLLPVVNLHHHHQDDIFFPFFIKHGVIAPFRKSEDHLALKCRLNKVKEISANLLNAVNGNLTKDLYQVELLQNEFSRLCYYLREHFEEEETQWLPLLKRFGKV